MHICSAASTQWLRLVGGIHKDARVPMHQLDVMHMQFQRNYMHKLEVHDVGLYRLKGLSNDVQLKSLAVAALRGRTALFSTGIKAAKAVRVQAGAGLETVRSSVLISPAAGSACAVCYMSFVM